MIVASYNVHGCVGVDGRYAPERIVAVVQELAADVVALQEVDTSRTRPGGLSWLERLGRDGGFEVVVGPTVGRGAGFYGNALLTRKPLASVVRHDLSVRRREPRGAVDVVVQAADGLGVRVVATHLGLKRAERAAQVEALAGRIAETDPGGLLVVAGDMNEWVPFGRVLRRLQDVVGPTRWVGTWPSRGPLIALDRVFVRPAEALRGLARHASPLAREASDHLPLRAVVATRASDGEGPRVPGADARA